MTRNNSQAGHARVTTLTLNPAIDISSEAEEVRPTDKIRTVGERIEPGGGGINVAKTLKLFGVPTHAIYMAGGGTGRALAHMLDELGVDFTCIATAGQTRISLAVYERSTGLEYRFVPEGPEVRESEWRRCLEEACECDCDYLVASGSLPRGVPDDFYAELGSRLAERGIRFVLDTSGLELKAAVDAGGIYLLKPSRQEFEEIIGRPLSTSELGDAAARMVASGSARLVAITLGKDGAILVGDGERYVLPAVEVETRSAVGAGDSFLAAMTYGLAAGMEPKEAFRLGVAAGGAAAEAMGTELCNPGQARRLLERVPAL